MPRLPGRKRQHNQGVDRCGRPAHCRVPAPPLGCVRRSIHVVIYDDSGGLHASRLFFTRDVFGHAGVSLLDGGIQAWQRAKLPGTTEIPRVARGEYRPALRPELVASATWVRDRLGDSMVALVDARTPAEYAGTDVRAKRGGHIPGASAAGAVDDPALWLDTAEARALHFRGHRASLVPAPGR
jgi:3-mercaptopyruvate sulfurtransferase SseA